ncbi:MAG: 5-(carboxyamino)imidazole ribonucleotide synthase [Fluviicola sp.]|jgi:5-(carboxyamino)imidazole ribonucleotide synthase|uniref:5-(carboxyamino)imidazole ribonucleotide synthase n=1 Tax=Fluviicola sp. TaxID=1917219 RepID=UPI00262DCD6E|nr:5-(carboxyamino)imidazole ribonucleotide synthase [Fluviicola sp.]MDF3027808.1 5-(carboxyamino)imidazole ribonucleotide synthase [Fluviicola sp.]
MKKQWNGNSYKVGMLGGGQLGRMFIQEALNYDVHVHCLDPDSDAPCRYLATSFQHGSLQDYETVVQFGSDKDVVTVEIEHVNVDALYTLENKGVKVFPQPAVLAIVQDKGLQKEFYRENNLPTADFTLVSGKEELISKNIPFPYVLKWRKGGYDGKGVQIMRSAADLDNLTDTPFVVEQLVPFTKELAVIVARNEQGESVVYPTVECEFSPVANLVEFLFSPADISAEVEKKAREIALHVIESLKMVGILAVELFLTADNEILINEIAPRPHNSGHHTIECCYTSQFEQHLRSIVNAPLGSTKLITPGVMINLLGEPGFEGTAKYENLEKIISQEGVSVHLYGKQTTKPFRKMGHVTIYGPHLEELKTTGRMVAKELKIKA